MYPRISRLFTVTQTTLLVLLAACGSAVDTEEMGYSDADANQVETGSRNVLLAQYDALINPVTGEFQYTPKSVSEGLSQQLGFQQDSAGYLSQTLAVTLGNGWNTAVYDTGGNVVYLYETISGASGACMQVNAGGQHALGANVQIGGMKPNTVTASDGALDVNGVATVDYGDMKAATSYCRTFSLENPDGGSFSLGVNFYANSLTSTAPTAYLTSVNETVLNDDIATTFTFTGRGIASTTSSNKSGTTLVDPDGTSGPTASFDLYSSYFSANSRTNTSFTLSSQKSAAWPANGFFLGVTESNGTLTGPFIRQNPGVKATISAALTGDTSKATHAYWFVCTSGASCPNPSSTGNGCVSGAEWDVDSEIVNGYTLADFVIGIKVKLRNLTSAAIGNTTRFYVALDVNSNGIIDSGDKYYYTGSNQTIRTDQVLDLGSITMSSTVTVSCGY